MRHFLLIILLTIQIVNANAQIKDLDRGMRRDQGGRSYFTEIKPKLENPYSQSYFYDDNWNIGSIIIKGEVAVHNKPLKYDIVRQWIEIKETDQVMVVTARLIDGFKWFVPSLSQTREFVKSTQFEMADGSQRPVGFMEVLVHGDTRLLNHKQVKIFVANSSVSLSGSHRSHDIYYVDNYYLERDGKLYPLSQRKKKDMKYFKEHREEILKYSRKNGLLFRREGDLIRIVTYHNHLDSGD